MHSPLLHGLLTTFVLAGCALFGARKQPSQQPSAQELTPAQEARLREIGGEPMVTDGRLLLTLDTRKDPAASNLVSCFVDYVNGHKALAKGDEGLAHSSFHRGAAQCARAAHLDDGHYTELAERYGAKCAAAEATLTGRSDLRAARKDMAELEKAEGPRDLYSRDHRIGALLKRASDALGPGDQDLVKVTEEYEQARAPHTKILAKVQAFMERGDIIALFKQRKQLEVEVEALERDARYSDHAKVILQRRRGDLDRVNQQIRAEAQKSNL